MKIKDLIEILQDFEMEHGEDCEVEMMTQKEYPFRNNLEGVSFTQDCAGVKTIHMVQGDQLGYGNKGVWERCIS